MKKKVQFGLRVIRLLVRLAARYPLIVSLADRDGEIYEWFLETEEDSPTTRAEWIIRAAQNRAAAKLDKNTRKLWEQLEKTAWYS